MTSSKVQIRETSNSGYLNVWDVPTDAVHHVGIALNK